MATDVRIEAGKSQRVEKLGLPPLNNVLVNVLLNAEAYARNMEAGIDLQPIQCGSMTAAAYLFEPSITITPTLPGKDPGVVLPEGNTDQVVDYWRNCRDENELSNHFSPSGVVDAMRPADPAASDRLGMLTRLRVAEATYAGISSKLEQGAANLQSKENLDAIAAEKNRLDIARDEVRKRLITTLERSPPVTSVDPDTEAEVLLTVKTPIGELKKHLGGSKRKAVATLLEWKLEYDRLNSILSRQ